MMDRILIVGCCGSGKSTLAMRFSEQTGLAVYHLDRMFWRDGWTSVPKELFDARLAETLSQPRWIIDGNYNRTLSLRLSYCDTVIDLDYPLPVCLWGILSRVLSYRGRTRPDMADGCPERVNLEFLRWVWRFNRDIRPGMAESLQVAQQRGVTVIRLKSRRACNAWLRSLHLSEKACRLEQGGKDSL